MRIATVSDLHTDYAENREAVVKLAVAIHEGGADVVVVAGDISHRNERIARTLEALKVAAPVVAYLPGNHDLWFDVPAAPVRTDLNTWTRYHDELRALAGEVGAHYLPAEPLYMGSTAIVGTCGWYDYSLMKPALRATMSDEVFRSKQFGGVMWSDARFIAFRGADGELMPDERVARQMESELGAHLAEVAAREAVRDVVVATHHLAFEGAVKRTGTLPWEFFNAFMGSTGLGEVIRAAEKVRTVVYGHTHIAGRFEIDDFEVYGTPLGYPRERPGMTVEELISTRIGWIDLPESS